MEGEVMDFYNSRGYGEKNRDFFMSILHIKKSERNFYISGETKSRQINF